MAEGYNPHSLSWHGKIWKIPVGTNHQLYLCIWPSASCTTGHAVVIPLPCWCTWACGGIAWPVCFVGWAAKAAFYAKNHTHLFPQGNCKRWENTYHIKPYLDWDLYLLILLQNIIKNYSAFRIHYSPSFVTSSEGAHGLDHAHGASVLPRMVVTLPVFWRGQLPFWNVWASALVIFRPPWVMTAWHLARMLGVRENGIWGSLED